MVVVFVGCLCCCGLTCDVTSSLYVKYGTKITLAPYQLLNCIVEYAQGQGGIAMTEICFDKAQRYCLMVADQDDIGWRRFMEGVVCHCACDIQDTYSSVKGSNISPCQWAQGLVIKLLERTHGQWLYRCVQIHDKVSGTCITACKEEIQWEI
jgi:hypothetical protein